MAPTAIYTPSSKADQFVVQAPSKGVALVVGSLVTAQDGQYQTILASAEATRDVEKQMIDRILDGATNLPSARYSLIHIILSHHDYLDLSSRTSALLKLLFPALVPRGMLRFSNLPPNVSISADLTLAGFEVLASAPEQGSLMAQRPAHDVGSSLSLKSSPLRLPKGSTDPDRKAAKKALWSLNSPSTPRIDAEKLLTEEDRRRPEACEPPAAGAPRRKKACKGCTCGLAEMEAEELQNSQVVFLDGAETGKTQVVPLSEKDRLVAAAAAAPKATSSCGSCYLGDAFRCSSCPYLGLPAFKPGEKVEISLDMDDI
ncbi:DUF689-domain-containing protein, partial [Sistotremastrum suecicum HHB10207 ss-3]